MTGALLLVSACLLFGVWLGRGPQFPQAGGALLGRVVTHLALPPLAFLTVWRAVLPEAGVLAVLVVVPAFAFLVAAAATWLSSRLLHWSRDVAGVVLLASGLSNTSFLGFPLVQALRGPGALETAVIVDQGQFFVLMLAGVTVARLSAGQGAPGLGELLRGVVSFPPFPAFSLGLLLRGVELPAVVPALLEPLAALVMPLALVAVGTRLPRLKEARREDLLPLALGLLLKLVLVPAAVLAMLRSTSTAPAARDVAVLETAMSPMVTAGLLALEAGLRPRLTALLLGVGVWASLVTVPLWHLVLSGG